MRISNSVILIIFIFHVIHISCGSEMEFPQLEKPLIEEEIPLTLLSSEPEKKINDSVKCVTESFEYAPGYDEPNLYDPTSDIIYPGSILKAESVTDGSYVPIIGNRKPIVLSISDPNTANGVLKEIESPSLSSVRNAIQEFLKQSPKGSTGSNFTLSVREIFSAEHFKSEIGGNYGNLLGSISGSFKYSDNSILSRYILEFTQVYYSIDMDHLEPGLENFFTKPVNNLGKFSPVYVSSVKYGRKVILIIESRSLSSGISAQLEASFKSFFGSGGVSISAELDNLMSNKSIKALVLGGDSQQAIEAVLNFDKLYGFLIKGANYGPNSPGAPLSYALRFVNDNSIAKIVIKSKFQARKCTIIPAEIYTFRPKDIIRRCPKLIGGDRDFVGHGPDQRYEIKFAYNDKNQITIWYTLHLRETIQDHSEAKEEWTKLIGQVPKEFDILGLETQLQIKNEQRDKDHQRWIDYPKRKPSFVDRIEIMGDTKGNDIGNCTADDSYISIYFTDCHVRVRKK